MNDRENYLLFLHKQKFQHYLNTVLQNIIYPVVFLWSWYVIKNQIRQPL